MAVILPKQIGTREGKVLFHKSENILNLDQGREIVASLKETLEHYGGVGLAAPQIGILKRVFIVNIMPTRNSAELPKIGFRAYINPEILQTSSETHRDFEGCLSVFYATVYGLVGRATSLKMKYVDTHGEEQTDDISHPFHARVVLHEHDHLEGKIFFQRIKTGDFSEFYWEEQLDIRKKDAIQRKSFSQSA